MPEPHIQIGHYVLTEAQAMAVRVAVTIFRMETSDPEYKAGLGLASTAINEAYHARLGEGLKLMLENTKQS